MKPVTYDFDVITDAPARQRRLPQRAEPAPQPGAEQERRQALSDEEQRARSRAAE